MVQTLLKNILSEVGNYPTNRISGILREVGNITNIWILGKVGNHPTHANQEHVKNSSNYPTYGTPDILSGVGNIKYLYVGNKKGRKSS